MEIWQVKVGDVTVRISSMAVHIQGEGFNLIPPGQNEGETDRSVPSAPGGWKVAGKDGETLLEFNIC